MVDRQVIQRADYLFHQGELLLRTATGSNTQGYCDTGVWSKWYVQTANFLERMVGEDSVYYRKFLEQTSKMGAHVEGVKAGLGILSAVRDDTEGGYFTRYRELVHASVFSDFLEMSEYLIAENHSYADPAAVLAGSVLEEHLRLLCQKSEIDIERPTSSVPQPKKADQLNADLASAGAYDKNQQKIITGWLGIRNSAAHGKRDEYNAGQVEQFIAGLRDFLSRYPA